MSTPHPFFPFPLPCQRKPVMWLSEIMRWEFYCSSLAPACQSVVLASVGRPLLGAQCTLSGPATMHFKRVRSRAACRNDNATASLQLTAVCQSRGHKGMCSSPALFFPYGGSAHSRGTPQPSSPSSMQEEGSAQTVVGRGNVRARGRTAEETDRQQIVGGVLFDCWSIIW